MLEEILRLNHSRSTLAHPTITSNTIPVFNNVLKGSKILTSLDMEWKKVPDFGSITF